MTRSSRQIALMLALVLALGATACSPSSSGEGEDTDSQGCGDCVAEIADLERRLAALDGVARVARVLRVEDTPTNAAGVDIDLESSESTDTGLADGAARLVWESEIDPVEVVNVTVKLSTGDLAESLPYRFEEGRDHDAFVARWGERPVD